MLKTSIAGLNLIRRFEGEQLTAYLDPGTGAAPWTIGVGHTGPEVHPGLTITPEQSMAYLRKDVEVAELAVNRLVTVPITQGQFDALVSFVFNLGSGALKSSTLLRKLNAKDYDGAASEFKKWCHAGGKLLTGLVRRRAAEAVLFQNQ